MKNYTLSVRFTQAKTPSAFIRLLCVQVCVFPRGQQSIFQDWHCDWAVLMWRWGLSSNGKRPVLSWNPAFFGLCALSLIPFWVLVSVVSLALTGNFSWILHMHSTILRIPNSICLFSWFFFSSKYLFIFYINNFLSFHIVNSLCCTLPTLLWKS